MCLARSRALWVPGKKLISIPREPTIDEEFHRVYIVPALQAWQDEINAQLLRDLEFLQRDRWPQVWPRPLLGESIELVAPDGARRVVSINL